MGFFFLEDRALVDVLCGVLSNLSSRGWLILSASDVTKSSKGATDFFSFISPSTWRHNEFVRTWQALHSTAGANESLTWLASTRSMHRSNFLQDVRFSTLSQLRARRSPLYNNKGGGGGQIWPQQAGTACACFRTLRDCSDTQTTLGQWFFNFAESLLGQMQSSMKRKDFVLQLSTRGRSNGPQWHFGTQTEPAFMLPLTLSTQDWRRNIKSSSHICTECTQPVRYWQSECNLLHSNKIKRSTDFTRLRVLGPFGGRVTHTKPRRLSRFYKSVSCETPLEGFGLHRHCCLQKKNNNTLHHRSWVRKVRGSSQFKAIHQRKK